MDAKSFESSLAATSTGSTISVTFAGIGEARVFVVGGMSAAGIRAGSLPEALANLGARCALMDIAPYGESRHPGPLTMDVWVRDVEDVFERCVGGRAVWIGSSMGAWLMMLVHRRRPEWFSAMCGLAPAFDWDAQYLLPRIGRGDMRLENGLVMSGATAVAPESLLMSMAPHRLLGAPFALHAPFHVIFGGKDEVAGAAPIRQFLEATTGARCTADFFAELDHGISKLQVPVVRERFSKWLRQALSP
jgi:pimeloyl-ACP methyl ester carboxylesterase